MRILVRRGLTFSKGNRCPRTGWQCAGSVNLPHLPTADHELAHSLHHSFGQKGAAQGSGEAPEQTAFASIEGARGTRAARAAAPAAALEKFLSPPASRRARRRRWQRSRTVICATMHVVTRASLTPFASSRSMCGVAGVGCRPGRTTTGRTWCGVVHGHHASRSRRCVPHASRCRGCGAHRGAEVAALRAEDVDAPAGLLKDATLAGRSTKGGHVGLNRFKARVRHLFKWAIAQGYRDDTPFKRHGVNVVRLDSARGTDEARLSRDRVCTAWMPASRLSTYIPHSKGWSNPVWNLLATRRIWYWSVLKASRMSRPRRFGLRLTRSCSSGGRRG